MSTVTAGPSSPSEYATRPEATLAELPLMRKPSYSASPKRSA